MQYQITVESGDRTAARWIVEIYAENADDNIPIRWDETGLIGRVELADGFHQMTITARSGQSVSVSLRPSPTIFSPPGLQWPVSVTAAAGMGNQADKTVHFLTGAGA
ncbi:hypothetical protein [Sphingomonas sp. LM7]|uniref:hypothetical protein n=1 Tax=Sphingomonas sp. LM7 TaxID=1938607 RepID=UPI000983EC4C|nr:hypothetical protein [Sphingomonas sp. LM7]AQR73914.1 hypothetical protein BXU08_09870 [Sphingomonas sp. LM7]